MNMNYNNISNSKSNYNAINKCISNRNKITFLADRHWIIPQLIPKEPINVLEIGGGSLFSYQFVLENEVKEKIKSIAEGISESMGATASFSSTPNYPATVNTPMHAQCCAQAAETVVGKENVLRNEKPSMGSEDFSFLLNASEGAYIWIGNGLVPEDGPEGGCMLHNTQYDFNDEILPIGASYWVQLVQYILK